MIQHVCVKVSCRAGAYRRRLRAVGLTEAVGEEEEDRERGGAAEPMDIREEAGPPSGALISLLASSLLLRDTKQWREKKFDYLLGNISPILLVYIRGKIKKIIAVIKRH